MFVPTVSTYYSISQQILIACILSVTALTLFSSLVATIISAGYPREKLEFIRHYAVFNIVSCKLDIEKIVRSVCVGGGRGSERGSERERERERE